eukprot:4858099-Amphidinium_carterae.1
MEPACVLLSLFIEIGVLTMICVTAVLWEKFVGGYAWAECRPFGWHPRAASGRRLELPRALMDMAWLVLECVFACFEFVVGAGWLLWWRIHALVNYGVGSLWRVAWLGAKQAWRTTTLALSELPGKVNAIGFVRGAPR